MKKINISLLLLWAILIGIITIGVANHATKPSKIIQFYENMDTLQNVLDHKLKPIGDSIDFYSDKVADLVDCDSIAAADKEALVIEKFTYKNDSIVARYHLKELMARYNIR